MNTTNNVSLRGGRVYVAGHRGLAGSAIMRALQAAGIRDVIVRNHSELDLTDAIATRSFFEREHPDYVFLAAAKVGGILANAENPAEFIQQNLAIQTNVIHEAYRSGVKRLLFLGSSCIYPRDCPQPMKESDLLTGPLECTNRAYAIAKIAGIEMCWAYNRQYGTRFIAAMPTNLYGPHDNFDLRNAHVLPALLRKFHEAKESDAPNVSVWGSGQVRREFLHADDLGAACLFLMGLPDDAFDKIATDVQSPIINVGSGSEITVKELADLIAATVGYKGKVVFDSSKPDGTPRKLLDGSYLRRSGWTPKISLSDGIASAYQWYIQKNDFTFCCASGSELIK